jgi:hypothetical protein
MLVMQKGIVTVTPENAKRIFYNDLSQEEAGPWIARLQHQSLGVYSSTQTHAGWKHIPSTYITASRDASHFQKDFLEFLLGSARAQCPTAFDVVERCEEGGHCLMISHGEWLAECLGRAAGEEES